MILLLAILIGSGYAILKTSDLFVDLASHLGRKLKLKDYFIGSLIVGVGTSLPELFTSIAAIGEQEPVLVAPNIFGTVVANIGAGFGLAVLALYVWVPVAGRVRIVTRKHALVRGALTFGAEGPGNHYVVPLILTAVSVVLAWAVCRDGEFGRRDAGLFFIGYAVFLLFEFSRRNKLGPSSKSAPRFDTASPPNGQTRAPLVLDGVRKVGPFVAVALLFIVCLLWDKGDHLLHGPIKETTFLVGLLTIAGVEWWLFKRWCDSGRRKEFREFLSILLHSLSKKWLFLWLVITITVVYFSSVLAVKALIGLAGELKLGTDVLAASALAVGTSLPDIVVALNVARRGRHRLLAGHIVQSNVFDVFLIMAVCGFATPLHEVWTGPSRMSIFFAIALTLPLLLIIRTKRINFWGGFGLFAGFLLFLGLLYG